MQLPFTVMVESSRPTEFQRVVRTRWRWVAAMGIIALSIADPAQPLGLRLGSAEGESPTWRSDGSIVALARPASDGRLPLRLIGPGGETRDLAGPPIKVGSAFAARLHSAHAQAIVAVRGSASLGTSHPRHWLVRFRPEADR